MAYYLSSSELLSLRESKHSSVLEVDRVLLGLTGGDGGHQPPVLSELPPVPTVPSKERHHHKSKRHHHRRHSSRTKTPGELYHSIEEIQSPLPTYTLVEDLMEQEEYQADHQPYPQQPPNGAGTTGHPKKEKRLFSFLFPGAPPPPAKEEDRTEYPFPSPPFWKRTWFWWIYPIMKKGYYRTLTMTDLWTLPELLTVEVMHARFDAILQHQVTKQEEKHLAKYPDLSTFHWPGWLLPWCVFLTFKWQYIRSCLWLLLAFAVQTTSAFITKALIEFVQYRSFGAYKTVNRGVGLVIGVVILIVLNGIFFNHFMHDSMMVGAQTKAILTKLVLLKLFRLLARLRYTFPRGRITSLMSTDLAKIDLALGWQPMLICIPVPIIISIIILVIFIGVPAVAGFGLFLVSLAICVILLKRLYTLRQKAVVHTDSRINMIREVISNIKIIKFYAWEMAYKYMLNSVRDQEMHQVFKIKLLRNIIAAYAVSLPGLTLMLSFVVMWKTHKMKAPGYVFSALSLFTILSQAIMMVPYALATGADAMIGFKRCTDFLSAEEEDPSRLDVEHFPQSVAGDNMIVIRNANFVWEQFHDSLDMDLWANSDTYEGRKELQRLERERRQFARKELRKLEKRRRRNIYDDKYELDLLELTPVLQGGPNFNGLLDVNLQVKRGEFLMVCGSIGLGKSLLLNAIAGSMKLENPLTATVAVNAPSIFCLEAWIQNATIRDNILFGRDYDEDLYKEVIFACALEEDILNMPGGDKTEIGERGVTLSGGQRARVSLARACYSQAPILLFDDVLLAVDSRVAKHIITYLFQGLLINQTVVLATHQLLVLEAADRVAFLNGHGHVAVGLVDDLMQTQPGFASLMETINDGRDVWTAGTTRNNLRQNLNAVELPPDNSDAIARVLSDDNRDFLGKLTREEEKAVNAIGWLIYRKYLALGLGRFGWLAVPLFLFLTALATFFQLFTNTWLSFWTEKKYPTLLDNVYVGLYVMFAFLTVIFNALEFTMLTYIENKAAQFLNIGATNRVMHAPMSYMDTTPVGRILNRFTKDTDSLDNELGEQTQYFVFPMALIIGIIILCICYLPWFAIAVPFLVFFFLLMANFYQGLAREVKRLEAVQRSLVFNNFNETLTGMATIQLYQQQARFVHRNDYFINMQNEAYYVTISTQRWLAVNLDLMGGAFALIIGILCVTGQFHISPSLTGLLLSYVVQIVGLLSLTVRAMTQVENEMNSAERLHYYAVDLPQEREYIGANRPPHNWPPLGYISFKDVTLRYRPELPRVLDDFNLNVYPGEKVGICGRTGAGKSSIMNALYRLTELEDGMITIDGLDIANIGLFDLRLRLLIIPQDPVIFQGTIRKNLDPFSQYNDDTLWDALRRLGLLDEDTMIRIRNSHYDPNSMGYEDLHKFHLDQLVDEEGSNFSLGEKQLLALARALVRNLKILILDEATSLVDFETDKRIQETISNEFSQCTILCIAHRLKTILHYDRIVVMDKGQVAEKGTPWGLYKRDGAFKAMCDKASIKPEDFA